MRLRPMHCDDVARILRRDGWTLHRENGSSHAIYTKSGCPTHVTLQRHKRDIPVGTLKNIIRQMGITRDRFLELFYDS